MEELEPVAAVIEDDPHKPFKAYAAALAPAVIALLWAFTPGSDGGSSLTEIEVGSIVTAALGAFGLSFAVPNPKRSRVLKRGEHEAGRITQPVTWTVLIVLALIFAVVLIRSDGDGKDNDGKHGLDWERAQTEVWG